MKKGIVQLSLFSGAVSSPVVLSVYIGKLVVDSCFDLPVGWGSRAFPFVITLTLSYAPGP